MTQPAPPQGPTFTTPTPSDNWPRRHPIATASIAAALAFFIGVGVGIAGSPSQAELDKAKQDAADAGTKAKEEADRQIASSEDQLDKERDQLEERSDALDTRSRSINRRERKVTRVEAAVKANSFDGTGTFVVGTDIQPGTYRAPATPGCYWERLSSTSGDFDALIANDNADGPVVVTIAESDAAFSANDCGTFTKVGQ